MHVHADFTWYCIQVQGLKVCKFSGRHYAQIYCLAENFGGEFGRLAVLRAIRQYFICQKIHSVMSSLLQNHSLCIRPAASRVSLIVGMKFTIEHCIQGHCFSKDFCTPKVGEELACLSMRGR